MNCEGYPNIERLMGSIYDLLCCVVLLCFAALKTWVIYSWTFALGTGVFFLYCQLRLFSFLLVGACYFVLCLAPFYVCVGFFGGFLPSTGLGRCTILSSCFCFGSSFYCWRKWAFLVLLYLLRLLWSPRRFVQFPWLTLLCGFRFLLFWSLYPFPCTLFFGVWTVLFAVPRVGLVAHHTVPFPVAVASFALVLVWRLIRVQYLTADMLYRVLVPCLGSFEILFSN